MLTKYKHNRVFMRSIKGFIKLAVEFGIDIIPYYGFGETDLYRHGMWEILSKYCLRVSSLRIANFVSRKIAPFISVAYFFLTQILRILLFAVALVFLFFRILLFLLVSHLFDTGFSCWSALGTDCQIFCHRCSFFTK